MKTQRQHTGAKGEDEAARFLIASGFEILSTNFRYKRAEIDIIAKKEDCIHFVEVKTRANNDFGYPETFVTERKAELFHEAAEQFIDTIEWKQHISFDIIAITKNTGELEYLADAF